MCDLEEAFKEYLEDGVQGPKGPKGPKRPKGPKGNPPPGPQPLKSSHPGDPRRGQHGGVDRSRQRRHHDNRHCSPGEVFENGVCMQKIGYDHHRRGYRRPSHRRGYIHHDPTIYTQPVVYRQPVVYTKTVTGTSTSSSDVSSLWDHYGSYVWIVLLVVLIIFVVSMMSNFSR